MYLSLFKELKIPESCLLPAEVPLIGFNGTPVWPLGRITLLVVTGSVASNLEFVVVDAPSPYNAILGRNWLHSIKAVASTYHQLVRYIGAHGRQEDLLGDQLQARQCYISAVGKTLSSKRVHWVEVPNKLVLEDVGSFPEEKSIEDLIKFPLNEDASRHRPEAHPALTQRFKIGKASDSKASTIRNYSCRSSKREVDKLLEAGAIKEVQYPTWLANPVVDCLPLPKIDQLVDATAGHARLSFLDAYRGYHQIAMNPDDMEKTAFITPRGLFCYLVMPFGLKNAGATFQRMIYLLFGMLIGEIMEAYIDDMVVKSLKAENHLSHLAEVFAILKKYKLRLNADKCAFGVSSWKFLGYLVTRRGIEPDLRNSEHPIVVLTEFPLKNLLRKADLSSRVSQWAVELANFDIHFEPRTTIKAQVLADFIAEFTPGSPDEKALVKPNYGMLEQQEARKTNGAGAGVVLVNLCGVLHETAIIINFPATNNEAKYEALLAGLRAATSLQVEDLHVFCDSQLIVNQVTEDYEARDPRMLTYQATALELIRGFKRFHIEQINRENNAHADAVASLASASKVFEYRHISLGEIHKPSFEVSKEVLSISIGPSWMDEIVSFLKNDTLPSDKKEAHRVRSKAAHYWISESGQLYRKSFTGPYLRVVHPTEGNGQAEATNKTVCAGIKRRLDSKRGKWAEELPRVLWAYHSTPRRSTGQTPFAMAFGMEAVIPLESRFPTLRTETFDPQTNNDAVATELILAEEKRDDAQLKLANY
ncbi:uncharacterized protein LOC131321231 [Rhododendron vialii]|uniref:uncharacterized protein LOC131321231 n=1 Tax=Rhododendron vialii TaxID=182163 RepID=UPI00265EA664|nr:uncharacterized protein LOC131321231 [Rhododendron vialii]